MTEQLNRPRTTDTPLHAKVGDRFGVVPNFFRLSSSCSSPLSAPPTSGRSCIQSSTSSMTSQGVARHSRGTGRVRAGPTRGGDQ